jgi:hypothetical protein
MNSRTLVTVLACSILMAAPAVAGPVLIPTQEIAKATNALAKVKSLVERMEVAKPGAVLAIPEPRQDNQGKYLCPFMADGSLAPWAAKGLGGAAGAAGIVGGDLLADEAGEAVGTALAKEIPGAGAFGALLGRKASKKLTDTATVKALGGWDYIRSTSELSFDSVMDLAVYMHANHGAIEADYALALAATMGIHPRLIGAYEPALKRAYARAEVPAPATLVAAGKVAPGDSAASQSASGHSETAGLLPGDAGFTGDEGESRDSAVKKATQFLTAGMSAGDAAATGGVVAVVAEANSMDSTGGTGQTSAELGALETAPPPPEVAVHAINSKKQLSGKLKFLNRTNRVIVAGFRVGFIVRDSITASVAAGYQFGGTHTSGASSKTAVELAGITPDTLQEITEELYQDFLADLRASGREVVSIEEIKGTEGFNRLDTTPAPYTKVSKFLQDRVLSVYTPAELPLWWEHGNQIGDKGAFATGNWKAAGAISVDHDAVIMAPTYLVSFAELESSGNKRGAFAGYGSGKASTKASPRLCILPHETKLLAVHFRKKIAGDMGAVTLKKQVVVGEFGARMVTLDERDNDSPTRAALLGLAAATGDQGIFAAAGAARSEQTLAVQTHPAHFKAHTVAALRGVTDAYIDIIESYPAKR